MNSYWLLLFENFTEVKTEYICERQAFLALPTQELYLVETYCGNYAEIYQLTLIFLVTSEEERALAVVVAISRSRPCLTWDVVDGFQSLTNGRGCLPSAKGPITILTKRKHLGKIPKNCVETVDFFSKIN